jgi:pimeloyl-ACP methyl ester carboxylesterase
MLALALVLVIATTIANPGPATASFRGTPGKVAYLATESDSSLLIWDPVDGSTTSVTKTVQPRTDGSLYGTNGRPVWSPDGTKIAFVSTVKDSGNFELNGQPVTDHTAIFVYDLRTGQVKQLTEPKDGLKPELTGSSAVGHVVGDFAPSWSGDGSTIAFTRQIDSVGDQDELWNQRGTNLWTVSAAGGGETEVTHYTDPVAGQVLASVGVPQTGGWIMEVKSFPEGAMEPLTSLVREGGSGRGGTLASRSGFATIADFDVSPDGTQLAYTVGDQGLAVTSNAFLIPLDTSDPEQSLGTWPGTFLRFSNTGSGLLRYACGGANSATCGMGEHPLRDPDADIRPDEPDRIVNTTPAVGPIGTGGTQNSVDVQAQTIPVIYIPGFLGSEIQCGGHVYWPLGVLINKISLDAAGNGTPACPSAGPNGKLVGSVAGKDIYGNAQAFIENRFQDRGNVFAWDWRKSPQATMAKLDKAVDDAINRVAVARTQGVGRVAIVAHSYGGLLTRAYLQQHKEKVARVLTLGTPYWGSPKAIFPLALGVETPVPGPGLDYFIRNSRMQKFAQNLAGNYQLYPARTFGSWLSLDGDPQSQAQVSAYVQQRGGNTAMLAAAQRDHLNMYDRFFDNNSLIDYRAVSGTGLATMGRVDLTVTDEGLTDVSIGWVNGDQTVPAVSSGQGPIGHFPPRGDPVHVQYTCAIDHVTLGGQTGVLNAYADFLDVGRAPRKLPGSCGFNGMQATFTGLIAPQVSVHVAARAGAAARTLSPAAAARAGLAQVIVLKRRMLVETDDPSVSVSTRLRGTVALAPITDGGKGKTRRYRVRGKRIRIAEGAKPGAAPIIRQGSKRLKPLR